MRPAVIIRENIGRNHEVAVYFPREVTPSTRVIFALHGNWATRMRNHNYGEYFAERNSIVIAPTYRHHYIGNESVAELGKVSVRDYAADIEYLIDNLYAGNLLKGFTPGSLPIVIGHSLGGLVAQLVAENRSLKAAILLCSAPPAGVSLHTNEDYVQRVKNLAPKILGGEPFRPDFGALSEYVYNGMPKELHRGLYTGAVYESGRAACEILAGSGSGLPRLLARMKARPIEISADSIRCSLLVIGCGKDKIIPSEVARDTFRKYGYRARAQDAETMLFVFPQFAHWPQAEPGWEASASFIHDWLDSLTL